MSILNRGQTIPRVIWVQRLCYLSESDLTTSPYGKFIGSPGKLWITCEIPDTSCSFSFIVEGGYHQEYPKWSFRQFVQTVNCNVKIPTEIIDANNYKYIKCDGTTVTSAIQNTVSHGITTSDCLVSGNEFIKFNLYTNDLNRNYTFVFSSFHVHVGI